MHHILQLFFLTVISLLVYVNYSCTITQLTLSSYISIWLSIDWPVVFLVANVQATKAIYLFILENLSLISLYIYSMLDKGTKSWLLIDCTANVRLIIYISQHPNTQAGHRTSPVVLAFLRSLQTPHHTIQHEYEGRGVCGGLASTIMVVLLFLVVASPPVVQCKCALIIQVFYHWLMNWLPACLSLCLYIWYCEAGRSSYENMHIVHGIVKQVVCRSLPMS